MKNIMTLIVLSFACLSCTREPKPHIHRGSPPALPVVMMTDAGYVSSHQDGVHTGYQLGDEEEPLPVLHEDFKRLPSYPHTHSVWMNPVLMQHADAGKKVLILLGAQRGLYMVNDEVAMDFPVCTGKGSKRTPTGTFRILQKNIAHHSNLYDCPMPYFMRLTWSGIGMHVGDVYRTPASHGCIRMPQVACEPLYHALSYGSRVKIME